MLKSSFMEADVRQLIQAIHDHPTRIVFVTAGAGTQALSELLGVAGATRTLLEGLIPYNELSFDEFLGQTPEQYVASNTASLMAGRAFTRARWLEKEGNPVIGVACTATITTDRPKRGKHRAYIAVWRPDRLACYGLHLKKGARNREGEENLVSRVLLNALAKGIGLKVKLSLPMLDIEELDIQICDFSKLTDDLHNNKISFFGIGDDGRIYTPDMVAPQIILSGAFNPLHDGHLAMVQEAARILNQQAAFELSAVNADKPPISSEIVLDRVAQFAGRWPIYVSNAPTFVQKARLYPGVTFVVGFDTVKRILHPRYYHNSQENLMDALAEIQRQGCSFLVAGRVDEDGTFRHLQDLQIPAEFTSLFRPIPDHEFRNDISSTELRKSGQRGSR